MGSVLGRENDDGGAHASADQVIPAVVAGEQIFDLRQKPPLRSPDARSACARASGLRDAAAGVP